MFFGKTKLFTLQNSFNSFLEFLDSSEVELIDPVVNDGDEAEGGDPIVLVIRGGSLPSLGNFPFPGGFPFRKAGNNNV